MRHCFVKPKGVAGAAPDCPEARGAGDCAAWQRLGSGQASGMAEACEDAAAAAARPKRSKGQEVLGQLVRSLVKQGQQKEGPGPVLCTNESAMATRITD